MKDYKEPTVEVIDLPAADIITTSGGTPSSTGSDTEMPEGNLLGTFGGASNPLGGGGAKWQ